MHPRHAGTHQPGHVLGAYAVGRDRESREVRRGLREVDQVVEAGVHAEDRSGGVHPVQAGQTGEAADRAAGVERVVEGPVEGPGRAHQPVGQRPARLDVDLEVRREEAEHEPFHAEREVVGGQPAQPRELATLRGEPVGEPERHPDREVARADDRADHGRFERAQTAVAEGSDVQPLGPALLSALGILRMQRDDLHQRHRAHPSHDDST